MTEPETHEPGDHHRYRIECEVCGQQGMLRVSIEPDRADSQPEQPAPLDVERLAEAWGNVMDGRRIGEGGLRAARISRGTTTRDDWQVVAEEYGLLAVRPEEPPE